MVLKSCISLNLVPKYMLLREVLHILVFFFIMLTILGRLDVFIPIDLDWIPFIYLGLLKVLL